MPVERFGEFELDEERNELRLRGQEIPLQRRVFDVLAFLVRNRNRVVDKNELLAALWPGVIVTDASVQRAISLARSVLRKGGLGDAIRTYARRGYRFCIEPPSEAVSQSAAASAVSVVSRARDLIGQSRWAEALEAYAEADVQQPLETADLEKWALAAQCAGALLRAVAPLERAAAAYSAAGDSRSAARANIVLARIQLESRETAVAKGCLRRAASLLQDLPLCAEHGHLAWMSSRFSLYEGEVPAGIAHAQRTIEISKVLNDADLETIGLLYLGVSLQASGQTRRGIELQDEAAAAVLSGDVSPLIGGIVYCGLIAGCCNVGDWPRAGQWTDSFSRWCERSNLKTFAGLCLLHRAEVFAARGELARAHAEILKGDDVLRVSAPWAVGDAFRLLGDVHLARGEFEQAETAYRTAHEHGWDPYPGYAMLLHYRGQSQAAIRGLQRAAEHTHWIAGERRGHYEAYIAIIAALSGDLDLAAETLAGLDAQPELWSAGTAHAQVFRARGELELANGNVDGAIRSFRHAVQTLREVDSPVDTGIVRLRLAVALARLGDSEGADLELLTAGKTFARTEAAFYVEQCAAIRRELSLTVPASRGAKRFDR